MTRPGTIVLASASPRRRALLEEAGWVVEVMAPEVDDGALEPGRVTVEAWVMALAYLKARSVWDRAGGAGGRAGVILGADTVCVHRGRIMGQARDAAHARWMLGELRGGEHHTMTGVCLLSGRAAGRGAIEAPGRELFVDRALVRVGDLSDAQIEAYVESGGWRGKAGAYNLGERVEAGWPIECVGDPATVMGLPMRRLAQRMALAARRPTGGAA